MKPIKKSTLLPLVLFIFATGMFIYYIPQQGQISWEVVATVIVEYAVIIALFFALRRKEKYRKEREEDIRNSGKHNTNE